jgi:thioredoxin 1
MLKIIQLGALALLGTGAVIGGIVYVQEDVHCSAKTACRVEPDATACGSCCSGDMTSPNETVARDDSCSSSQCGAEGECSCQATPPQLGTDVESIEPANETESRISVIHTKAELDDLVAGNSGLVLVEFYADWCGSCKAQLQVLESETLSSDVTIVKVDVDAVAELATQHAIEALPTMLLFRNGELIDRKVEYLDTVLVNEWLSNQK